jgi:hypothetical protein
MSIRYILINLDDEEDVTIFSNLRILSNNLRDIYNINKSHMYYQRSLISNDKLYVDRLLIMKIEL